MELCTPQSITTLPRLNAAAPSRLRSFPPSSSIFRHHSRLTRLVARAEESSVDVKPFFPPYTPPSVEENVDDWSSQPLEEEPPKEDNAVVGGEQNEFLANLKWDSDNAFNLILYGGGALVFLWLTSGVVRAVDSIPLFSKLMEVVGLGYATWFTIRYVLFKKNREELISKFDDLKRQVIGSSDE